MRDNVQRRQVLVAFGFGSICSYELSGEYLVGRLFGLFTVLRIHLGAVHYLRIATRSEIPGTFMLFNWINFLPHRKILYPVYVLQTRLKHRLFLKLDSRAHFSLRQAIGRNAIQDVRIAA